MSEATSHIAANAPEQDSPPPFDPDPDLIGHLEGNKRALRGYRREAESLREQAQRAGAK